MNLGKNRAMALLCVLFLSASCARLPLVEPTVEEMEAAKRFKKTVAIMDFDDKGSAVRGAQAVASGKVESVMVGLFNLVEREKIDKVMEERDLYLNGETQRFQELGQLLGADLVVLGNVVASLNGPELEHRESTGKYYSAEIWEELCAESEVALKMVDVSNGITVYADQKGGEVCQSMRKETFSDGKSFQKALKTRRVTQQAVSIIESFGSLRKDHSLLIAQAIEEAARGFSSDLRKKFSQEGEIIEIISSRDVLVNLGSAYGIQPGDRLIVWEEDEAFRDPKTGVITIPKRKKAILKVIQVTSGLSCIARGHPRDIARLELGDKINTH